MSEKFEEKLSGETRMPQKISDLLFQSIEKAPWPVIVATEPDEKIIYANESACKVLGYSREELLQNNLNLLRSWNVENDQRRIRETLGRRIVEGVLPIRKKNGRVVYIQTTIIPVEAGGKTRARAFLGKTLVEEALTSKEDAPALGIEVSQPASNLRDFLAILKLALPRHKGSFWLLIVDLHDFFLIISNHGIRFSNLLLEEIEKRLKEKMPQETFLVRREGGKFLVILFQEEGARVSACIASILEAFSKPFTVEGKCIPVSVHIGATRCLKHSPEKAWEVYRRAYLALLKSKEKGENTYFFYSERLEESTKKYLQKREELLRALSEKRFVLFIQPYYATQTGKIAGSEVLLRLKKEDGGIIPASDFIEILESSNLITRVEEWILEEIKKIAGHKKLLPLSVNISPNSFNPSLIEKLRNLRETLGIPLACEITERLLLEKNALKILKKLKEMGIKIIIDDFGKGFSSLSYLEEIPADALKIDISFIKRMAREPKALTLVQTIIDLARKLGLKTIAEGVETRMQLKLLRLLMCDYAQGFLLSKPLPIEFWDVVLEEQDSENLS